MEQKFAFREDLIQKWTPFLEGVESPYKRNYMAICMENVQNHIAQMKEAADEPVGRFAQYAVPLSRRVLHDLAIGDLISIQGMAQPDGKVFFLDFKYNTAKGTIAGTENVADALDNTYTADAGKGQAAAKLLLSFTSAAVSATAKKITGELYIEDEQDLYTYYGLSGEEEMLKIMAQQVIREINNICINEMYANVGSSGAFDATLPTTGAYGTYLDPKVYRRKLYETFVDVDNAIFKKRFVTPNWIIAGPDACAFMEKMEDFKAVPNPSKSQMATGLFQFGTFAQRWNVYKYAFMPVAGGMLMGYKGVSEFEAGYVYAPYISAYTTAAFTDPNTFKKARGLMTRSDEVLVSGDFYGKIVLSGY